MPSIKISVTVPKTRFTDEKFVRAIVDKMKSKTIPDLKSLFGETVNGWDHKPSWGEKQWQTGSEIGGRVFATGENADRYALVSSGSPPHPISAKPGKMLRFRHGSGYKSATKPGLLKSSLKSSTGDWVMKARVSHPGFEERNFPETIKKEYDAVFKQDMQDAMNNAAKS